MTMHASEVDIAVAGATRGASDQGSYVDWAAIIAGAVLASAISFVLFTFGGAIGLSLASPVDSDNPSPTFFMIAAAIWFMWVTVSSFMAGGYLAGRMRRRLFEGTEHEADVRDGGHGLMVWALGTLIAALLAASGAAGIARTGVEAVSTVGAGAAEGLSGHLAERANPMAYTIDMMLRPAAGTATTGAPDEAGTDPEQMRAELGTLLAGAAGPDGLTAEDRSYAARLIAERAGISQAEAESRVDAAVARVQEAERQALEAAEAARKGAIMLAFLTAATMLVSALGAWWAAGMGGNHRDRGTEFLNLVRWR